MSTPSPSGPVMLCATEVLRPPQARIGSIGGGITLPRTVPVKALVAGGIGALFGVLVTVWTGNVRAIAVGVAIFGGIGVVSTNLQPLPGESLTTWVVLSFARRRRAITTLDGDPVRVAVGIMPVKRVAQGQVQLVAAAIPVQPGTVCERGVPRTARNRNVPAGGPPAAPPSDHDLH